MYKVKVIKFVINDINVFRWKKVTLAPCDQFQTETGRNTRNLKMTIWIQTNTTLAGVWRTVKY